MTFRGQAIAVLFISALSVVVTSHDSMAQQHDERVSVPLLLELDASELSESYVRDLVADYENNKQPKPVRVRMMSFDDKLGEADQFVDMLYRNQNEGKQLILPLFADFSCQFVLRNIVPQPRGYYGVFGSCANLGTSSVRMTLMPKRAFEISVTTTQRKVNVHSVSDDRAIVFEAGRRDLSRAEM